MSTNWNTQEIYESFEDEIFEGDIRKLDELIGQLEVWSDIKTINHKMELARLEEYVELDQNLYDLKNKLVEFIESNEEQECAAAYKQMIEEKFVKYQETEDVIHNWIKDIKELEIIIMKSSLLQQHKERLDEIINK